MNYTQELEIARENGIPPLVLVQHIAPVVVGARKVSMAYAAHFGLEPRSVDRVKDLFHNYLEKFGMDVETSPYGEGPLYMFRSQDRDTVHSEIERMKGQTNFFNLRAEVSAKGKLLGYPDCCTYAFTRDNTTDHYEASRIEEQLISGGHIRQKGDAAEVNGAILPAFFTEGFYPCRPDCEHAIKIGNDIISSIKSTKDRDMLAAYETALLNNTIFAYLNLIHRRRNLPPEQIAYLLKKESENESLFPEDQVSIV